MNTIELIGNITKKPELKSTNSNKLVTEFSIAVKRIGTDKVDFINCQVWGTQAENLCKYQDKGSKVAVIGSLRVDSYKNDKNQTIYKTYVLANNVEYLNSKQNNENNTQNETNPYEEFGDSIVLQELDLDSEVAF